MQIIKSMEMNWKKYEKEITELFISEYPEADIKPNIKLKGRYSKVERQIDLLIEDYLAGNKMRIVIDAKYFSRKINVKAVESFIAMLSDVQAHKGLLITQKGYSKAAINRAFNDTTDIELDILNFNDLKRYQGFLAIPYAGKNAVLLPAPFGWVVDIRTSPVWLALLYQRGLELPQAQENQEWMYVNFWDRKKENDSLEDLIKIQEENIRGFKPNAIIKYENTIKRNDAQTVIRIVEIDTYPVPEITGFVEFNDFIFFCVLFTPLELAKKNIRKLENILRKIMPLQIEYGQQTSAKTIIQN